NARYFGTTIAKYDEIIRGRELNDNQVAIVNYVLKSRAQRYIAAAKENWLYPENILKNKDSSSFDKLFLGKKFKSISLEQETFILGKNGELKLTQDVFGRKPKNNEDWAEKEKLVQNKLNQIKKFISVNKDNN
ncbi:MAG: hypothetical protein Q8K02_18040, partial [Flavobacterium sp.]|nr:hypothetical protein [Flavobacterium sp.]